MPTASYEYTKLKVTRMMQEVRKAVASLHADSKHKLEQDIEVSSALDQVFTQVRAIRDGLAILSEAFIEETGKQNHRLLQVRILADLLLTHVQMQPSCRAKLSLSAQCPVQTWRRHLCTGSSCNGDSRLPPHLHTPAHAAVTAPASPHLA